jgi:hypothetical protein
MDLQSLSKSLDAIQSNFICTVCHLTYHKSWYIKSNKTCLFCNHFLQVNSARATIYRYAEWWYIKSGEEDQAAFYKKYVQNANRWCDRFQIPVTKESRELERELES